MVRWSIGGDDLEIPESRGFLWLRVGNTAEGKRPFAGRRDGKEGREPRGTEKERVLAAIRQGWDVAAADAFSFADAVRKLDQPAPSPPAPPDAATRTTGDPQPNAGYREEESIVRDALSRLQAKVHEEIGESDPDARYNLGIAYKEMGLLDEAAGEFTLARQKPELFVGASSLLADTLAEKGEFALAIATLDEVLAGVDDGRGKQGRAIPEGGVAATGGGRGEGDLLRSSVTPQWDVACVERYCRQPRDLRVTPLFLW
jgi:tetratricopeptide (TPR) repeat protein